jgi:hypothetical protein
VHTLMVERITFRSGPGVTALPATCRPCRKSTKWLRLPELLERFDVGLDALFAAFERRALHIALGHRGTLYVCESSAASLFRQNLGNGFLIKGAKDK